MVYAAVAPGFYAERSDPAALLPFGDLLGVTLPEDIVREVFGWKGFYVRTTLGGDNTARPTDLRYPAPEAQEWAPAPARRPNVLVLAIESLRSDIVTPETMPHLHQLVERSWLGARHFSAATNTHLALFSLLSGLSPSSWSAMTQLHRPLFTYELLRRAGYDVTATSSMPPNWFGLERNVLPPELALAPVPEWDPDPDARLVGEFQRYLERERERPFFAFLFFNGSHFPYFVPPGGERFQPSASDSFDVADPGLVAQREALFNRYRNAVYRTDEQLGRVLALLRAKGLEQDTLVVVTGDHGESFWDDGRFTHTSLLSRAQMQVPLVMFLPGRGARRLETLSHHTDVMPTLLDAVGISLSPELYADGRSLLRDPPPRPVLSMQFGAEEPSDYAFIDETAILRFHNRRGSLKPTGGEWIDGRPMDDAAVHQALEQRWGALLGLLHDTTRWLPGTTRGSRPLATPSPP
jgi:membrane-anchored protein YejM (alkaline phosphatase superfamily)